jgi:hypothetical protein
MKPIVLIVAALLPALAAAQSDSDLKRVEELDRRCEAARAAKLAPKRQELIEECVKAQKRSREECVGEFGNWGDTRGTASGARGGQFYDLPECRAADEARRSYRR